MPQILYESSMQKAVWIMSAMVPVYHIYNYYFWLIQLKGIGGPHNQMSWKFLLSARVTPILYSIKHVIEFIKRDTVLLVQNRGSARYSTH